MQFLWYCIYLELMTITMSFLGPYAINQSPSNFSSINELTWVAEKMQEWSCLMSQLSQKCTLIFFSSSSSLPSLAPSLCSLLHLISVVQPDLYLRAQLQIQPRISAKWLLKGKQRTFHFFSYTLQHLFIWGRRGVNFSMEKVCFVSLHAYLVLGH